MQEHNDFILFPAHQYNPAVVGSIGECLSPPFDIISPEDQTRLYARNDYNVIRLILGKTSPADNEVNNPYTRAKKSLAEWLRQKVIIPGGDRSFWLYGMNYEHDGQSKQQTGLIGLIRLQDYEKGLILPHERIIQKPMEDRIKLTGTMSAQCESIWGLYQDKQDDMEEIFAPTRGREPMIHWREEKDGIQHRMWRIEREDQCRSIQNTIGKQVIFIADGHHRYQSMLTLRDRHENPAATGDGTSPWDYIMIFLLNVETNPPAVLPYHRVVFGLPDRVWNDFIPKLDNHFEVRRCSSEPAMLNELKSASDRRSSIGCVLKGQEPYFLLTLKNRASYLSSLSSPSSLSSHASGDWQMLDMNILNSLVLDRCLGLTENQLELQGQIDFSHNADGAIADVRSGETQAAFLLNAPRPSTIMDIARSREIMPWKSTFFYPKPLSGLLFYLMEEPKI